MDSRPAVRTEKGEGLFQEHLKKHREKLLKYEKEIDSCLFKFTSSEVEEERDTYKSQVQKLKSDLKSVQTEFIDFLYRNKEDHKGEEEVFNSSRYLEHIDSMLNKPSADQISLKSDNSSRSYNYRAKVEVAKVKLQFAQQQVDLKKQQAAIAAEIEMLQSRTEVAALEAEANYYESLLNRDFVVSQPPVSAQQKTEEYINSLPVKTEQNNTHNISSEVVHCIFRKDMLLSRLSKFDDDPAHYAVWKATFKSVIEELGVISREEVDLLLKWLGPNSAKQAWTIQASNVNDPGKGLERIWERLEERFAAPEIIHSTISQKIMSFPKIIKDPSKLYDLADLTTELEYLKENPKLSVSLSFYDSSAGVNQLVTKLPYHIQDKWTRKAIDYKRRYGVLYPPFALFAQFIRDQAKDRNDPSFEYERERSKQSGRKTEFNVKKTETNKINSVSSSSDVHVPEFNCIIHDAPHSLNKCVKFRKLPLSERKHQLFINRICLRCCESKKHIAGKCEVSIKCEACASTKHPTALHEFRRKPTDTREHSGEKSGSINVSTVTEQSSQVVSKQTSLDNCNKFKSCAKAVLVKIYKKDNPSHYMMTYVLIDDQSNRSLAKTELLEYFGEHSAEIEYTLASCGGRVVKSGRVSGGFVVEGINGSEKIELSTLIECNDIPNNIEEIPTPEVCEQYSHLNQISTCIPQLSHKADILLLIGRDTPLAHHVLEQIIGEDNEPFAQKLRLGWVIVGEVCHGSVHASKTVNVRKTYILNNERPSLFKSCDMTFDCDIQNIDSSFDSIGSSVFVKTAHDNKIGPSIEDRQFIKVMDTNCEQNENGNWVFPLPFKEKSLNRPLPSNFQIAEKRAQLLSKSLKKQPQKCEDFCKFMDDMFKNGHAEVAPPLKNQEEHWYLPIFGVYHPKKPSKIRVVFDSSAKCNGVSLNDVLMTGPDLTNSLIGVLLRFRKHKTAVIADIQQMFFCFCVKPDHKNFLRFLWFRDNDPEKDIIEYRMCVHVFGNSPSPAIATYGLHRAISSERDTFGEDTCDFVMNNFYVDDGLLSVASPDVAIDVLKRTQAALKKGGNLRLHKIASNSNNVLQAFDQEDLSSDLRNIQINEHDSHLQKSLGVSWDLVTDCFTFTVSEETKPFTRRGMLSVVNSMYDPLGFAAPITIQGKLFLRNWISGNDWDEQLPSSLQPEWEKWKLSLIHLSDVQVKRAYGPEKYNNQCKVTVFCDASKDAIAAVAYLSSVNSSGQVEVSFVMGKSKVAPRHGHTIPRLELCAAVLGLELAELVCEQLNFDMSTVKFYSDSQVVLGYIYNETRRFYVYVTNRVDRIRSSTQPSQWKHVVSEENPADQGTRRIDVTQLQDSMWLNGSPFMQSNKTYSGNSDFSLINPDTDSEVRQKLSISVVKSDINTQSTNLRSDRFKRFSQWQKAVNAIVTLKRLVNRRGCQNASKTYFELKRESEILVIKEVQETHFHKEIECLLSRTNLQKDSKILSLNPYIDKEGILRVGGRLKFSKIDDLQKYPIIIPGSEHISRLLVEFYHEEVKHQGRVFTEGILRSKGYWIIGAKRLVASVIHACVICRKLRGKLEYQKMADLPDDRVNPSPPFSCVGLDVFGPWEITTRKTRGGVANSKRWAVLFTCLSTRAVHIELIEEMTSSSFINALRRFMSIRGTVVLLKSDRGTNFVSGAKELGLNSINVEDCQLQNFLQNKGVTWRFNSPHSSHKGGVWERMIGVSRRILNSMLLKNPQKHLTHEVLSTLMYEVSAIINSRPLVSVSYDSEDPTVLTPSILLTQKFPDMDISFKDLPVSLKDSYKAQWKCVQYLADIFWSKWKKEYLQTLQSRQKWVNSCRNIQTGDVVLLKDSSVHRNQWPMGLITETFKGEDDLVRQVQVKVIRNGKATFYQRPVTELIVLLESDI